MFSAFGNKEGGLLVCVFDREAWRVCDLWEDASVRSGWMQGLLNMLKHRQALDFICQKGENCHHLSSKLFRIMLILDCCLSVGV